ncbi:hypothetical protein HMI54_013454 [Coelomomyces lativittatus]|nr:hypothetical protein HMI54_013454 [Coelomomyces lativittatus]
MLAPGAALVEKALRILGSRVVLLYQEKRTKARVLLFASRPAGPVMPTGLIFNPRKPSLTQRLKRGPFCQYCHHPRIKLTKSAADCFLRRNDGYFRPSSGVLNSENSKIL